ncbi:MAG: carboxypeptidase regulatory-like domain-containing protein [Acidobacteria bacterium]|nr:carboxypeptidase regulatory-like domain-containing protein [Acidobacteriota bacterium]
MALVAVILAVVLFSGTVWAQVTASISGTVKDASGAVVPGATVTIRHLETGATRIAESDVNGGFTVSSLPVGEYEITAERAGFKQVVRRGITLVVNQQAVVNFTLEVGAVEQQVTVTAELPLVSTTPSSTSGLVGEKQVNDLPLNGRSFDQLVTLNVGVANYTSNTGHNAFSVGGRRPEENRFILNGVEYVGSDTSGQRVTPNGVSGNLLGVDAVREFNVVQGAYGAEYGKRAGGQINIVTSSGTNQLHGGAFEFLRHSKLDAPSFFDNAAQRKKAPLKRNQFGGSLGGPLKHDKLFLFGNYEGLRQRLGQSVHAVVPDANTVQGMLPCGSVTGVSCGSNPTGTLVTVPNLQPRMLPLLQISWPKANGSAIGSGLAFYDDTTVQRIRDDFGLVRVDYTLSSQDSLSGTYMIDDGDTYTPNANPVSVGTGRVRSQVISLQETRIFSPTLLNVATIGFARGFSSSANITTVQAAPDAPAFITGRGAGGQILLGAQGNTAITSGDAGGGPDTYTARNAFTLSDDLQFMKGNHSFTVGGWFQRNHENISGPVAFLRGQISYASLLTMLQDSPTTFFGVPALSSMGFRHTEAAWYVQDEIKLNTNLTLRVGLREEMTNGWNEVAGRATNYFFTNGVINTNTHVGPSALTENNAKALWQPRAGIAWDPTGNGTWSIRAGAGIYHTLQDNLAHRLVVNPPFNSQLQIDSTPLFSIIPLTGGVKPPPQCQTLAELAGAPKTCTQFQPGGVEPNFHTPTIAKWSFTVERELTRDLMLQAEYAGSEAYHLSTTISSNIAPPQVCSNPGGCLAGGTGAIPVSQGGTLAAGRAPVTSVVPQGTVYMPPGPRANPLLGSPFAWFFYGTSSYQSLHLTLMSRTFHGLAFKTAYSFSKVLDVNSAISASGGGNQPQTVSNPYDLSLNRGLAAFNLRHQFNGNYTYELPFGEGKAWGSGVTGIWDKLISGWQWNGILQLQSGFPFTPTIGANRSGTGDSRNPDVPSWNPAFAGEVIKGKQTQWFDPNAFMLPLAGTFGNAGRGVLIGPRLANFDTSLFKNFLLTERWNLQFRAEAFNVLNHTNFGRPSPTVFQGANVNSAAGVITTTATKSRNVQFALKLTF